MADPNVAANPDAGNNSPGAGNVNPNPAANAGPAAGQPGAQPGAGQPPAEKSYSFKEDRSDWIPPHRLSEQGRTKDAEITRLTQALEAETKRTRALAGLETPSEEEAQAAEIKTAILKLFPGLKSIEQLSEEQIQEVLEAAQSARSTASAQWERHAESMFTQVEDAVADSLGVDKLTESQVKRLRREYREAAQEALLARPRDEQGRVLPDPTGKDFLTRHERGDKTLIEEFAKSFLNDWYEPARRSVTRQTVNRQRPVPSGGRTRNQPVSGPPQIDYNNDKAFGDAILAARNSGA